MQQEMRSAMERAQLFPVVPSFRLVVRHRAFRLTLALGTEPLGRRLRAETTFAPSSDRASLLCCHHSLGYRQSTSTPKPLQMYRIRSSYAHWDLDALQVAVHQRAHLHLAAALI